MRSLAARAQIRFSTRKLGQRCAYPTPRPSASLRNLGLIAAECGLPLKGAEQRPLLSSGGPESPTAAQTAGGGGGNAT